MRSLVPPTSVLLLCLGLFGLVPASAWGQDSPETPEEAVVSATEDDPLTLTLNAAVSMALKHNLDLKAAQLNVQEADAQVREAWGNLYPSLDLSGGYTRNVVTANPFAGSDAANLIGGGGETEWLAFNERRRLDGDPTTQPVSFPAFQQRQRDSLAAAGISLGGGGGNPFGVDNSFRAGLQLTQTLYSKQAFASVKGSEQAKAVNRHARDRQVQTTTNQVMTAFYDALLAARRAQVRKQRVQRAQKTLQEVTQQVRRGVTPKAQRLGAEVELSNARTQQIQARNAAELARDNLKQTIGISPETPIRLEGDLEQQYDDGLQTVSLQNISMSRAVDQAIENRPDLRRAELNVELREIQKESSRAAFFPRVEAVANLDYSGRVPDNRSRTITTDPQDPTNPFYYAQQERGFFNDDFWNPSFSVGLQFSWNLFNGFQSSSRLQQAEIQRQRAQTQLEQLRQGVKTEVRGAVRNLENARERVQAQQTTVRQAKLNYDHVSRRVAEGEASPIELREASDQLDQSRLNYLQAVYDYLVARSDLETALGQPLTPTSESYLMTGR